MDGLNLILRLAALVTELFFSAAKERGLTPQQAETMLLDAIDAPVRRRRAEWDRVRDSAGEP